MILWPKRTRGKVAGGWLGGGRLAVLVLAAGCGSDSEGGGFGAAGERAHVPTACERARLAAEEEDGQRGQVARAAARPHALGPTWTPAGDSPPWLAVPRVHRIFARGVNAAQGVELEVDARGLRLWPMAALRSWSVELRWTGIGRRGAVAPVPSARAAEFAGGRVALRRSAGIEEWYASGRAGIEQGFVLAHPPAPPRCAHEPAPACGRAGPGDELVLELDVGGELEPVLVGGGRSVSLRTGSGRPVLRYTDPAAGDALGRQLPVRLEVEGATLRLVVDDRGATYPVQIDPLLWAQAIKLIAANPKDGDGFGWSVATSADVVLVGAPHEDAGGKDRGAAYVFYRDQGGSDHRGQVAKLVAGSALVGAPKEDQGNLNDSGAAYVFGRNHGGPEKWGQVAKLVAGSAQGGASLGFSVALSAETALVGAPKEDEGNLDDSGAAYVFYRDKGGPEKWGQVVRLVGGKKNGGSFGWSVALAGDAAVTGAPGEGSMGMWSGRAHHFVRNHGGIDQWGLLVVQEHCKGGNARFGTAVAAWGNAALVGAPEADAQNLVHAGDAVLWAPVDLGGNAFCGSAAPLVLAAGTPAADDRFGGALALFGDLALVGADGREAGGNDRGAAYLRARNQGGPEAWGEVQQLVPGDAEDYDHFGAAVAVSADLVVVGARDEDGAGVDRGAAYVFAFGQANGEACAADGECGSKHCVDGLCCDAPCDGGCEKCSSQGACVPLPPGSAGEPSCSPLVCDGKAGTCPKTCGSHADCVAAYHCQAQACVADLGLGQPCAAAEQCQSGHCASEICCDQPCTAPCWACSAKAKGQGQDGACGTVAADADPKDACPADPGYPASCLADGWCDGQGECRAYAKAGTGCGPVQCEGSALVAAPRCNGMGQCLPYQADCWPYACDPFAGGCLPACSGVADCASQDELWCNAGVCEKRAANGAPCAATEQCQSGHCVDGYCCSAVCQGQCEACDVAGGEGSCVPVAGMPHGDRPACPGSGAANPCAAALCDGHQRQSCKGLPGTEVVCRQGSCTAGTATREGRCDGSGSCEPLRTHACAPYACGAAGCQTACAATQDCAPSHVCVIAPDAQTGQCQPVARCDGGHTISTPGGASTDCRPYRCTPAGSCLDGCVSSADCAPGFVCSSLARCVAPAASGAPFGGCGCRLADGDGGRRGRAGGGGASWPALLLLLGLARRSGSRARSGLRRSAGLARWAAAPWLVWLQAGCGPELHGPGDESPAGGTAVRADYALETAVWPARRAWGRNAAQGMELEVDAEGLRLWPREAEHGWSLGLRLARVGRPGALVPAPPPERLDIATNRATLRRAAGLLDEWYANDPLGVEQGFVLTAPIKGQGELVLELELSGGLEPVASTDGRSVSLRAANGRPTLRYTGLVALDARDRLVPARLEASARALRVVLDDRDAAYPLRIDPWIAVEAKKLVPSAPADAAWFGAAAAISADTAIVGSHEPQAGTYVFYRDHGGPGNWGEVRKLAPGGDAVALAGDVAVVGVPTDGGAGAAYVFYRNAGGPDQWGLVRKLVAADAQDGDELGRAVAATGDVAVVGAPGEAGSGKQRGAAYVFHRSKGGADNWGQAKKLEADKPLDDARFGRSVAVQAETALVGAHWYNGGSGAVFVYYRNQGGADNWGLKKKLVASDQAPLTWFGISVVLDEKTAIVGAYGHDAGQFQFSDFGAAYVFYRDLGGTHNWGELKRLSAPDAATGDELGSCVALWGDTAAVGAMRRNESGTDRGAAYVVRRNEGGGDNWGQVAKLVASDGEDKDYFGSSAALAGMTVLVGAQGDDGAGKDRGAAYVVELHKTDGDPCQSDNECASGLCVDGLCCNASCAGPCDACNVKGSEGSCAPLAPGSAGAPSCSPYLCDGQQAGCPASCGSHADCVPDHHCDGQGSCVADFSGGTPCGDPAACAGGHCADGVCCDISCQGSCIACTAALKGSGKDGTCGVVLADTDPKNGCEPDVDPSVKCPADGLCDGKGYCRIHAKEKTPCGQAACAGDELNGWTCQADGTCTQGPVSCSPYRCEGSACTASCAETGDCAADGWCDQGECRPRGANGEPCTEAEQCGSGHCVDGYCCHDECSGQCEACDVEGGNGSCVPVVGEPHGQRPPCPGPAPDNPCVAAQCDGLARTSCQAPVGDEVLCRPASCADGVAVAEGRCAANGSCQPAQSASCAPYACGADRCQSSCATSQDCAPGYACAASSDGDGACEPEASCDGDHTVSRPEGGTIDCTPYRCAPSGACLGACQSAADCVAGLVCDSSGRCTPPAPAGARSEHGGCGCEVAGRWGVLGSTGPWWATLLALGLIGAALRRLPRRARADSPAWPPLLRHDHGIGVHAYHGKAGTCARMVSPKLGHDLSIDTTGLAIEPPWHAELPARPLAAGIVRSMPSPWAPPGGSAQCHAARGEQQPECERDLLALPDDVRQANGDGSPLVLDRDSPMLTARLHDCGAQVRVEQRACRAGVVARQAEERVEGLVAGEDGIGEGARAPWLDRYGKGSVDGPGRAAEQLAVAARTCA
ncbi:MAG: hypothetical protein HY744_27260 [Deltaproteobacteria bacterium]|nr:hypothetical protein [Deltaproteobacteria bacterium]